MRPEPLTALAADEPDRSHAAAVCLWLARDLRHRATEEAHEFLARLNDEVDHRFRGFVVAAVPAPLRRPAPDELPEVVRRDGWNAVINRRDTLAYQVAEISDQSMERNDWPVGQPTEVSPERCPVAAEFVDRLEYASTDDPPTALEHILLSYGNRHHVGTLLHDPQTELPALRRHPSDDSPSVVFVTPPDRLPSLEPLESVILSDGFAWIRTADGRLWPAPQLVGAGLAYGYRGSGPTTLAVLLERLLDDITAPAVPLAGGEPSPGLLELARQVPEDKTTVLTRDQLEHARLEQ